MRCIVERVEDTGWLALSDAAHLHLFTIILLSGSEISRDKKRFGDSFDLQNKREHKDVSAELQAV